MTERHLSLPAQSWAWHQFVPRKTFAPKNSIHPMPDDNQDVLERRAIRRLYKRVLAPAPVRFSYRCIDKAAWALPLVPLAVMVMLGNVLHYAAFYTFIRLGDKSVPSLGNIVAISILMTVMILGGQSMIRRFGGKLLSKTVGTRSLLEASHALYLRPFIEDHEISGPIGEGFSFELLLFRPWTTESVLVKAVNAVRPVFAVANPFRSSAELGAYRIGLPEQWQPEVSRMMQQADFVIIRVPGSSDNEGTLWEIEHSLSNLPAVKVLFYLPGNTLDETRKAWFRLEQTPSFRERFPNTEFPGASFAWINSRGGLEFSSKLAEASVESFQRELEPFLKRFDSTYTPASGAVSWLRWFLSWRPLALILCLVSGLYLTTGVHWLVGLLRIP